MSKSFNLGDLLSITTGKLVSHSGMDGVYGILNYMTGDNLFTHQLPGASDECRPYLLKQFPQLAGIVAPERFDDRKHVVIWVNEQEKLYGSNFAVEPLPNHIHKDPIEEMVEMVGVEKVLVAQIGESV